MISFDSFGSKPLPNRNCHIVLTRDENLQILDVQNVVYESLEDFKVGDVHYAEAYQEFMVIGGQQIYEQFMSLASTLYVTELHNELDGDACFPPVDSEISCPRTL